MQRLDTLNTMISSLRVAAIRASARFAVVGRSAPLIALRTQSSPTVFTLRHFSSPPVRESNLVYFPTHSIMI